MSEIDPRAVISPSARLGSGVRVGPFAIVGDEVELGDGCVLEAHAVVNGPSRLGRDNHVYSFAIVGGDPQDLTYAGQRVTLEVGDSNEFREFSTVHRGTIKGGGVTRVGSHNLIMAYAHIAHDCIIGNHTIIVNGAQVAGHITVEDYATIGSFCLLHPFSRIGAHSYIGAGTVITQDVPPFSMIVSPREVRCLAWRQQRIGLGAPRFFLLSAFAQSNRLTGICFAQNSTPLRQWKKCAEPSQVRRTSKHLSASSSPRLSGV